MMKKINSNSDLQEELKNSRAVWLLLIKSGSAQSDCAAKSYSGAIKNIENQRFLMADVNQVRDIHPVYGIHSVPSLLEFKDGEVVHVIKGCHQPDQFRAAFENTIFVAKSSDENKPAPRVIVYTTPTCSWCTTLKRHLDHNHVKYREIDITRDEQAATAMVRKSGQQGVPQTEINGQIVVGFDKDRINRLLEIK